VRRAVVQPIKLPIPNPPAITTIKFPMHLKKFLTSKVSAFNELLYCSIALFENFQIIKPIHEKN
jgi:hypothetical protein